MRRRLLKSRVLVAGLGLLAASAAAGAASLTNTGSESQTIIVTENGIKKEFAIEAGETINFCTEGCFLTLPGGDRRVLGGPEAIEIIDGSAVVK